MPSRQRVLITGISGNMGKVVARELHRDYHVIGIDRRPFHGRPKDVEHHLVDIRRNSAEGIFKKRNIHAVVHLNIVHDPRAKLEKHYTFNIYGTTRLLEYCAKYGVQKFIFVSSANIYGPRPESSGYLGEGAPLMASQAFSGIQDLIAVDLLVQSFFWKKPELEVVILRPAHIIGPRIKNAPTNYLKLDPALTLLGFDPLIQLVHVDDITRAMKAALKPGARGIYNLAGPCVAPLSTLLRMLGRRTLPIPKPFAKAALDAMWKARLTSFPPPELAHIQFQCLVDDARARSELGYVPSVDLSRIVTCLNTDR